MIKKLTALSFISIAVLLFLAHAVISHHHHNGQICIEDSHCESDCSNQKHGDDKNDHKHDGESSSICCVLKQDIILPTNYIYKESIVCTSLDIIPDFISWQTAITDIGHINQLDLYISNKLIYYTASLYSMLFSNGTGMRAPPIV